MKCRTIIIWYQGEQQPIIHEAGSPYTLKFLDMGCEIRDSDTEVMIVPWTAIRCLIVEEIPE